MINQNEDNYLNFNPLMLLGGVGLIITEINKKEAADEQKAREQTYAVEKTKYPITEKMSCADIEAIVTNIQNDIDGALQSKTLNDSKDNQKLQARYIDGWTRYQNEVKAKYNTMQCEKQKEDAANQEFFAQQYTNLEKAKTIGATASNVTKWLIIGMLGAAVIISGVIIFKKKKT